MEMEYGETTLVVKAKGTDSEALLRTHTAQPNQVFRCHVCQEGCSRQDVGDYKVHALKGRQIKRDGDEPWTGNLGPEKEEDDENANLRRRVALLAQEGRVEDADREVREGVPALPRQGEMPGGDKKKKKKKKEKKDKHILDGRHPGLAGQKTTQEVFWRYRPGSAGEGPAKGPLESTKICVQQEVKEHQRIVEFEQFLLQQPGGGQGADHRVCRGDQDQGRRREVSRCAGDGVAGVDETVPS